MRNRQDELPRQLCTEYIRKWLLSNGFSGLEGQTAPNLDESVRQELSGRYVELFEQLTGHEMLRPDPSVKEEDRIKENIEVSLSQLSRA